MPFHLRRLIDHVHLRVSDLDASKRFDRAIPESLDLRPCSSRMLTTSTQMSYLWTKRAARSRRKSNRTRCLPENGVISCGGWVAEDVSSLLPAACAPQ